MQKRKFKMLKWCKWTGGICVHGKKQVEHVVIAIECIVLGMLIVWLLKATDRLGIPSASNAVEMSRIAITFDDGPHPKYTPMLLDGLKDRNVKVSFFVTGEHVTEYPEILQRITEEGHLVGNHTYSHMQLQNGQLEAFKDELVRTNEVIGEITGQEVSYVRPPYGIWDKSLEAELNMFPVLWTIDPLDWCTDDVNCIIEQTICKAKDGDIILLHDNYESSVQAALGIIDILQQRNFRFVTVDEILFD